eukprot:6858628-Prymnesium_polylepis.2
MYLRMGDTPQGASSRSCAAYGEQRQCLRLALCRGSAARQSASGPSPARRDPPEQGLPPPPTPTPSHSFDCDHGYLNYLRRLLRLPSPARSDALDHVGRRLQPAEPQPRREDL